MDDKQFSRHSVTLNTANSEEAGSAVAAVYKQIPEENLLKAPTENSERDSVEVHDKSESNVQVLTKAADSAGKLDTEKQSKMVQDENPNDGADEQMLGAEDGERLAEKRDEVKFIKGDHQNGDAKIDIGKINGKAFTGMTKEELMKYANDPFWIRLRWIFFILFWVVWLAMLVCAILIIVDAPKCAAPEPLPWYKQGPLAKFSSLESLKAEDLHDSEKVRATGAIYELPAELTYSVKDADVEDKIKALVAQYKDSDVNVILDITPNYATKNSQLMKDAMLDDSKRSAFLWIEKNEVPNNWLSIVNGSAWSQVKPNNFVLSQFGDGLYDLHMNDSIVKRELGDVLRHLINLGVKGIRFKNSKFFLVTKDIRDEVLANNPNFIHTEYGFWTHSQTTFQQGLGDVLYEYLSIVKNASDDAFLSVAEDVVRPDVYLTSYGNYGIEMPIYGRFTHVLSAPNGRNLEQELLNTLKTVGNETWLQWNFAELVNEQRMDPSAITLFVSLLPGVPVIPLSDVDQYKNISETIFDHIQQLRLSPSYMHGEFRMHKSETLIAYSRLKSGNPGTFVAFNPTEVTQVGNFSFEELPERMTVDTISDNFDATTGMTIKSKAMTNNITVSPHATVILTYVPVKSG